MVFTKQKAKQIKSTPIVPVEPDPARQFMSYDEVVAKKKKEKEIAKRLEEAKAKIEEEVLGDGVDDSSEEDEVSENGTSQSVGEKIAELSAVKNQFKGPGSLKKKEEIDVQIAELESQQ